jgi:serine/threonine-protein kinase HipA
VTPRCLSSLEPLEREGFTATARRRLAGGDRPFPHRLPYRRGELLTHVSRVVDRMSVSGVQEKVSLRLLDAALEPTGGGGEYILKLVGAELPQFSADIPANEHVSMLIAERVFGLEVPPCALVRLADDELAYIVKRFDLIGDVKHPQEDFSQLMERTAASHGPGYKYDPAQAEALFAQLLVSYALSNGDAHLKNFSVYRPDPAGPPVLTPVYDILCTSLHIPNESRLALEMFEAGFYTDAFLGYGFETYADFRELARRFGIEAERARVLMQPFVAVRAEVEDLVQRSFLSDAAKSDYRERYHDRVKALSIGSDEA